MQHLIKYHATSSEILCNIKRNAMYLQYSRKYCGISKEIRCNIKRNTVEYLRSVVTCSVGGDRNVTRERDAAHRPITAGLLVWHNFYFIFHIVFHLYFNNSAKCISITAGLLVWHNFYIIFHIVFHCISLIHPSTAGLFV